VSVEPVMLIKFAPASIARVSPAFTTKGLTCSSRRRGARPGGGVEEPGVLSSRNGARAVSRSQGFGHRGTKQEPPRNETGGSLLFGVRVGGGGRR
jgi:hypothetical protein